MSIRKQTEIHNKVKEVNKKRKETNNEVKDASKKTKKFLRK